MIATTRSNRSPWPRLDLGVREWLRRTPQTPSDEWLIISASSGEWTDESTILPHDTPIRDAATHIAQLLQMLTPFMA